MGKLIKRLKFLIITISIVVLLVTISSYANFTLYNKNNNLPKATQVNNKQSNDESSSNNKKSNDSTNILIVDDNSKSMMIATINAQNKNIDLNPIEDKSYINPTINEDFLNNIEKSTNISLDKFIQFNLEDLMNIVSNLDGIKINVKEDDLQIINNLIPKYYSESTDYNKGKMELLSSSGEQVLNEYQAMAYTIAIKDDINKQKEMLISLMDKVRDSDFTKYVEVFKTVKPYVDTNLNMGDILKIATSYYID